jgi:tetratricopeptide (TPR) repeat protein
VELYYQLGTCELRLEKAEAAQGWFKKALELDPTHRPSLLAQMEHGAVQPESLIDAKKALLKTATAEERPRLLTEIGDLYLEKLSSTAEALSFYRDALTERADDQRVLHKCLDVYVEQKQWTHALEMLERLIAVEKVLEVRAKYRHAAGLICRDELGRPADAARLLTESLDDDPSLDRSAEALEALLTERQEWKDLARFYRRALKRLGPENPTANDGKNAERLRLWSALGELCLDKLGEPASALAALEVALTFDRGNLERHRQLGDLYVQAGPDHFDKAIVEHQIMLAREKQRVLSYRALKHLYIQTSQRDKAAACSYALTFLKKGEPDDLKVVGEVKARPYVAARRPFTEEHWGRLMHPDEDRVLAALFAAVSPMLAAAQAQPHKQLQLNRKDGIDFNDPRPSARAFKYVSTTFALSPVEVYARPEQAEPFGLIMAAEKTTLSPCLMLGPTLLNDKRPERESAFELARRVAHLRPERLLRLMYTQPAQVAHILDAALAIGADSEGSTPEQQKPELQKTVQGIKRALSKPQLDQVAGVGRKLKQDGVGAKTEALALAWMQATDLTASRAALVLGGDLETCARLLAADPATSTTLPATQRLLDLVWSSVTEDVFAVRKQLGLM